MDLLTNGSEAFIADWDWSVRLDVEYAQYVTGLYADLMRSTVLQLEGAVSPVIETDPSGGP